MENNPENMGKQEAEHTEGQTPAGGISRRRVLIAGAMLAPVFMTLRVPTASAGGDKGGNKKKYRKKDRPGTGQGISDTASCTASECPGGPQGDGYPKKVKGGQTWWGQDSGNHKFVDEYYSRYDD